jgi:DNA-binding response OmpR family regulator
MRILVIEDNSDIAANLGDYLEDRGHIVDFAADGVTGLHLAVVNDFDAIVLDLNLPGMDGLEVCRKFRVDARKTTPILMLTARDALEQKLTGFDAGADDYLVGAARRCACWTCPICISIWIRWKSVVPGNRSRSIPRR